MKCYSVRRGFAYCSIVLAIGVVLFSDYLCRNGPGVIHTISATIAAICYDPSSQWVVVLCLGCYFAVFFILQRRLIHGNGCTGLELPAATTVCFKSLHSLSLPDFWMVALVLLALLRYSFGYDKLVYSTQVPVLLVGMVFGKATAVWTGLAKARKGTKSDIRVLVLSNLDSEKERAKNSQLSASVPSSDLCAILLILTLLLASITFFKPEMVRGFQYHNVPRWSGIFGNPNFYGVLMGVGIVVSLGLASHVCGRTHGKWLKRVGLAWCSSAAVACGIGLFKSYSRGAWLGAAIGLAYFGIKMFRIRCSTTSLTRTNFRSLVLILIALSTLAFWQFRFSNWPPIQRIVSVTNINDYSWRNRITAWEGAIHMMIDRPWFGFGWGQAALVYAGKYCPLVDSGAIQLNDIFMIGISAGTLALISFAAYIWLTLRQGARDGKRRGDVIMSPVTDHLPLQTICRAGAMVLLIGFWFDGGLFEFSVGPIFWMLMELSRLQTGGIPSTMQVFPNERQQFGVRGTDTTYKRRNWEVWSRRTAWVLATMALLQTTVYLATPFFLVDRTTLTIARSCLLPPKEICDFNFLVTNVDWHGRRLQILLQNADLANYNRQLVNWQVDDFIYRKYILTPTIEQGRDGGFNWRRELWETLYPRVRDENDPRAAAQIVYQQLRDWVKLVPRGPLTINNMWMRKEADTQGFEALYVAALRSVGVPARLNSHGQAEIFADKHWQPAP